MTTAVQLSVGIIIKKLSVYVTRTIICFTSFNPTQSQLWMFPLPLNFPAFPTKIIFEITFPTFLKIDHVTYYLMGDKVNSPRILVKYKAEGHIFAHRPCIGVKTSIFYYYCWVLSYCPTCSRIYLKKCINPQLSMLAASSNSGMLSLPELTGNRCCMCVIYPSVRCVFF